VIKGQRLLTHKGSLADRFAGARQVFTQQLLEDIFSFNDAVSACDLLYFEVKQQQEKLNAGAQEWINTIKSGLDADKIIGLKFISSVSALMREEAIIENNSMLQKRITDAANHFYPKFAALQESI